jgi:hypothetical protein
MLRAERDLAGCRLDSAQEVGWNEAMASSHSHGSLPQTEPVTPLWLTFTGVGLFVLLGAWYMYRASTETDPATDGTGAESAAVANPAQGAAGAKAGNPSGLPSVAPNGQPIMRGDDIVKMLNAPAGQHP